MTIVENFGRLLKQFRQQKNMSREEFADRLGSNPSTIYSYEKSRRTPSIEFLRIMYDVYGVEPNYFFGIEDENKEQDKDGIIQYLEQKIVKLTSSKEGDSLKEQMQYALNKFVGWMNDKPEYGKTISIANTTIRQGCYIIYANSVARKLLGYTLDEIFTIDFEDEDVQRSYRSDGTEIKYDNKNNEAKQVRWGNLFATADVNSYSIEVFYKRTKKRAYAIVTCIRLPNRVFILTEMRPLKNGDTFIEKGNKHTYEWD